MACRDELERAIALFVEFDGVLDGTRLCLQRRPVAADRSGGVAQQLDDRLSGGFDALPGDLLVVGVRGGRVSAGIRDRPELDGQKPPVTTDQLTQGQLLLPPPVDVAGVAAAAGGERVLLRLRGEVVDHVDQSAQARAAAARWCTVRMTL